jgi:hypothetical protein
MAATTVATITAPQMKRSVENHQPVGEIKITGENFRRRNAVFVAMKFRHASAAETGFISQFWRNLRDEFVGDFYLGAPAWAFVSGDGAKLATIRLATERTIFRLANCSD